VVNYKLNGAVLPPGQLPPSWQLNNIEAVKEDWPAFEQDITGVSEAGKFLNPAQEFLSRLEKHLGVPILLVGTGPGREAIVVR
jgi:adenylosuccinate synthase